MAGNWQADFERGVQLMQAQEYAAAREALGRARGASANLFGQSCRYDHV